MTSGTVTIIGLLVIVIGGLIFLWIAAARRWQAEFDRRFPPISDADYLKLCAPGTNADVALRVRWIIAQNVGVRYEQVYPSQSFTEDFGID